MEELQLWLWLLDVIGAVAFALSGALAAKKKRMDFFGMVVLAGVTTFGGGLIRDTLLGVRPSAVFETPRYMITAILAAVVVYFFDSHVEKRNRMISLFDASGLAVFTVSGTLRAIDAGAPVFGVLLMAMLTGCGGGIIRDLLRGEPPFVLYGDIYATAALAGSGVLQLMLYWGVANEWATISCVLLVFGIRLYVILRNRDKQAF